MRRTSTKLTVYRSGDHGKTWKPQKTVINKDSKGNVPSMHMNEHGITLRHGKHKGPLIRPSRWYAGRNERSRWPQHYTNAIYSDDGGWQTSDPFPHLGPAKRPLRNCPTDGFTITRAGTGLPKEPTRGDAGPPSATTAAPPGKIYPSARHFPTGRKIQITVVWVAWCDCPLGLGGQILSDQVQTGQQDSADGNHPGSLGR